MGSIIIQLVRYFSAFIAFIKLLPELVKSAYELYKFVDTFGDSRKEAVNEIKEGLKEARLDENTKRLANILAVDHPDSLVIYETVASEFDISIRYVEKPSIVRYEDDKIKYFPPVEPQDHVEEVVVEATPEPPMQFNILGIGGRASSVIIGDESDGFLYKSSLGGRSGAKMASQFIAPALIFFFV